MRKLNLVIGVILILITSVIYAEDETLGFLYQRALHLETIDADYEIAIKIYESIIKKSEKDRNITAQAFYRMALCFEKLNNKKKANEIYEKIISEYKDQKDIFSLVVEKVGNIEAEYKKVQELIEKVDIKQANKILKEFICKYPDSKYAQDALYILEEETLRSVIQTIKEDDPIYFKSLMLYKSRFPNKNMDEILYRLIEIYKISKDIINVEIYKKELIEKHQESEWTKLLNILEGDMDLIEKANKVQKLDIDKNKRYKISFGLYNEIIEKYPNNERIPEVLLKSGYISFGNNKFNTAIKMFDTILENWKDSQYIIEALFWKAEAYLRTDGFDTANNLYQTILSKYPDSNRAKEIKEWINWKYNEEFLRMFINKMSQTINSIISDKTLFTEAEISKGDNILLNAKFAIKGKKISIALKKIDRLVALYIRNYELRLYNNNKVFVSPIQSEINIEKSEDNEDVFLSFKFNTGFLKDPKDTSNAISDDKSNNVVKISITDKVIRDAIINLLKRTHGRIIEIKGGYMFEVLIPSIETEPNKLIVNLNNEMIPTNLTFRLSNGLNIVTKNLVVGDIDEKYFDMIPEGVIEEKLEGPSGAMRFIGEATEVVDFIQDLFIND